jgi:large subunit ribosomal protein L15
MPDLNIHAPAGANKRKFIIGRGQGSGKGTTAGKGNKGQQSRSGGKTYPGFEGGQMPLYRRLAHRGFCNKPFAVEYAVVNLRDVESRYESGETVDIESLMKKGLVKKAMRVKLLATGEITKKLTVRVDKVSAAARDKIVKAGGAVEGEAPATASAAE